MKPTRSPDHSDFDRWAEGARPRLLRLVTPMLGGRHEAEDVVQETLLALWKRREQVEDWDAYAARATWLNGLRRKGRRRDWVPIEELEHSPQARAWEAPDLEPWELESAIAGLPAAQQLAIRMRFYAGHSFHEIGEALEISLNTAASRVRYGLEALREALSLSKPKLNPPQGGSHARKKRKH
jgi:RNA polymerase sigma-70 factor (ECF subfamily)